MIKCTSLNLKTCNNCMFFIVNVGDSVYTCSFVLLVSLLSFASTVIWKHKSKNILGLFGYIIILLKNSNSLHIGFQGMYRIKAPFIIIIIYYFRPNVQCTSIKSNALCFVKK